MVLWTVVSRINIDHNSFEFCQTALKMVQCKTGRSSTKHNFSSLGFSFLPCSPQTPKAERCPAERCLTTVLPICMSICVFHFFFPAYSLRILQQTGNKPNITLNFKNIITSLAFAHIKYPYTHYNNKHVQINICIKTNTF